MPSLGWWQVAQARPFAAKTLEERAGKVNALTVGAVGLRGTAWIQEESTVWNKGKLLPTHGRDEEQGADDQKKSAGESESESVRRDVTHGNGVLSAETP